MKSASEALMTVENVHYDEKDRQQHLRHVDTNSSGASARLKMPEIKMVTGSG